MNELQSSDQILLYPIFLNQHYTFLTPTINETKINLCFNLHLTYEACFQLSHLYFFYEPAYFVNLRTQCLFIALEQLSF